MNLEERVQRIIETYATARLYSDRGTRVQDTAMTRHIIEFETAFERPHQFSFSFRASATSQEELATAFDYARRIHAAGGRVRMGDPEWQPGWAHSLESGIAALTGVSLGTAHVVPRLLLPQEVGGRSLFEWGPDRILASDQLVDGERHHVIEMRKHTHVVRVWVSATTHVIRRIEEVEPSVGGGDGRPFAYTDYRAILT